MNYDPVLSIEELVDAYEREEYVEGIITIDLDEVIELNLELFVDEIAERLTGWSSLMDVQYEVVGVTPEGSLQLRVSGDPTSIVEISGRGRDE